MSPWLRYDDRLSSHLNNEEKVQLYISEIMQQENKKNHFGSYLQKYTCFDNIFVKYTCPGNMKKNPSYALPKFIAS